MPLELAETRPRSMQFSIVESCFLKGTISKAKHRRLAGTEYFGETAVQPGDHIPVNTMRKPQNHTFAVLMWLTIHNHA